jgi:nickel transport protein
VPSPIGSVVATGLAAMWLLTAGPAVAHGAFVDVTEIQAVAIGARYDTDEPMAGAQVSVFAPDDQAQPWHVGQTDAAGRFVFVPDDRAGRWAIQVRQAGHGAMGYVEVDTAAGVTPTIAAPAGLDPMQRVLMVASVVWGCIGTALYFRRNARATVA